jgi:hypothetical protein
MRKLLWCWTAGGVVLAGGLGSFGLYGYHHPDSFAGRCLTGCSQSRALLSPTTGLVPVLAEKVWHTSSSESSASFQECPIEEVIPDDPVAIPDCPIPGDPSPGLGVGYAPPDPSLWNPLGSTDPRGEGVTVDSGQRMHIIPVDENAPPAVVIHEEERVVPDQPLPPASDSSLRATGYLGESLVGPETCPSSMPYCLDEKDTELSVFSPDGPETLTVMPQCDSESTPEDDDWVGKRLNGPDEGTGTNNGCSRQPSSTVCPYTGRSYPDMQCPKPADQAPKNQAAPGSEEENEPLRLKKRAIPGGVKGLERPVQPQVDTMEYRASDGKLHDYGQNPL